jgi:hypothetical protein
MSLAVGESSNEKAANTDGAASRALGKEPGTRRARRPSGSAKKTAKSQRKREPWERDQLAVERIEHLHQLEGFLTCALVYVMQMGLESPTEWPALLQRPDGTRVQAPEHVVERAISLVEELCLNVDEEIRAALKLAPDVYRRKYHLLPRRGRDDTLVDNWLPTDETASSTVGTSAEAAASAPKTDAKAES